MVVTTVTTVLHPAAEDVIEEHSLAPRLPSLQGATVGLMDNNKRNADVFLEELGRLLKERYGVSGLVTYEKASQSIPTPPEDMDRLAGQCDAIVHAVADWGSCVSWGVHDGIEAEKRGRPAVTVITTAFTTAAQHRARILGLPQHPVVVIDHPIASKTQAQMRELAQQALDGIVKGLIARS